MKLDKWQEEALAHEGNLLLCTGRQVGKTTIMSMKAARRLISQKGCKIIIVSLTEDQAKLIIVMILDYLEKHHKKDIAKGRLKPTQNRIHLKNKSQVIARPVGNTGDAVRGFTGNVLIIDEASRMPELVWEASRPTLLTTAGEIWMCSTPHGKQGYFWEAYQNKDNRYKVIHTSSEEVIKTRPLSNDWTQTQREAAIRFLEGEKSDMSQLQYGQEYLGLFLDDLQRYFPDKLIDKCCTAKVPPSITHQRPYYLGVDIARMGDDESTFEIIKFYHKESLIHVQSQITRKTRTTDTEQRILELNRLYNFKKIYIDAGAGTLGVSVFDHLLAHPETKRKVVAINNAKRMVDRFNELKTRLLKEDLYDNLRSLMEKGWIQLLDDEKVRLSLRSVQFEFIQKPNSNSQMRIFGDYTHIVEGLIRAAWCAKEKQINTGITYI